MIVGSAMIEKVEPMKSPWATAVDVDADALRDELEQRPLHMTAH